MWNNPMHPGRIHCLATLPEKIEIARTSYRFYVTPNVFVFGRGKLDWVGTHLVEEAFLDQNRPALLRIFDVHDEIRGCINDGSPVIERHLLLARFDLGLPPFNRRG